MNFTNKIFYLLFFIILAKNVVAGDYPDHWVEKKAIIWKTLQIYEPQSGENNTIPYFDNCIILNNSVPVYTNKIAIPDNISENINYRFQQLYFEPIPESEMEFYTCYSNISDSISLKLEIKTEQKLKHLTYSFFPVRKNHITGKIERLRYFVLEFSFQKEVGKQNMLKKEHPTESVLNTGDWYKFSVNKSGVYQIFYSDLVNIGLSNPQNVRIYGNGGSMLPEVNNGNEDTDLKEIPVQFYKGSDGIFNEGDYFIFYAEGPYKWNWNPAQLTFEPSINRFNNSINYFITSKSGTKAIVNSDLPSEQANTEVTSFDFLTFHESDLYNLIRSGREFYGDKFGIQNVYDFTFDVPNIIASENITILSQVLARSQNQTSFVFQNGNQNLGSISIPGVNITSDLTNYANIQKFNYQFKSAIENLLIKLQFNKNGDESAQGWLDYIRILARANLIYNNTQLEFRDIRSVGTGKISNFTVSSANSQLLVWDITDLNNTKQVNITYQNGQYTFKTNTETLKTFILFDPKAGLLRPQFGSDNNGKIANQNLHSITDKRFIIVTHPDFISQANELASIHETKDGLSTEVVTTNQVYNEFSSGNPDPAAIRNFVKLLYDNSASTETAPKYLLLFGDGSYDNKLNSPQNTNYVLTYESANSLSPVSSYVSDDYFGILDNDEQIETGTMDIGVGRFPVSSKEEAENIINKIKKYTDNSGFGNWRNQICFIGDDEDNNMHMQQADQLANFVNQMYPSFNINKIYLDAYQQVSTSSGERYPDVNKAIYNQLNAGALIINYTGHGNENGLAHEQIIRQNEDINQWQNKILPLFVTATCEFSRFDDYNYQTGGEDVLLNKNGGGIALLTTTRLVYSAPNFILNQQFYNFAFTRDSNGEALTLGEIMRLTKNASGYDVNKLNFTLLGDPALKLAIPKLTVKTDSINKTPASLSDTVKAYQHIEITGHIEDNSGITSGFNGTINVNIFDKVQNITTLSNDNNSPFTFTVQNKSIFKGKATIKNGYFKISFVIPRDIDYNYGFGKISYYATNELTDATGYYSQIVIGGLSETGTGDNSGPLIKLFLNDTLFKDGGISNQYPILFAKVWDESGINPGGNGIGHDIIATIDNSPSQLYILNSYFQNDIDNFNSGNLWYQLPQIAPGKHTITFKIWDIFNNSSQAELNFEVLNSSNLAINRAYNYPNPFYDYTNFFFEHNSDLEDINATIEIFDMTGKKIKTLHTVIPSGGFTSGPIYWDGKDGEGKKILPGIYIYQIILRSNLGWVKSKSQKLVVID